MANPFLEKFERSVPLGCLMMYTGVKLCIRTMDFVINCHLHIYSISLFCNYANFGPRYPEKYVPHLFDFLENDYLDDKLSLY